MQARQASYEQSNWRIISNGLQDGPTNMALDEAILESVGAGNAPPTFRLYGWDPPCLSLGREQSWEIVDYAHCLESGWDVVRRPSGGRAALHMGDLSYSICTRKNDPRLGDEPMESCQNLAQGLSAGLRLLGLDPARTRPYYDDLGPLGLACLDGPDDCDIRVGQRKLVGSVQLHRHGAVLQHGTMILSGDVTRVASALAFDLSGQRAALVNRLGFRATTLEMALGRKVEFEETAGLLQKGLAQTLNVVFVPGELTRPELLRAGQLRAEKYASEAWTKSC